MKALLLAAGVLAACGTSGVAAGGAPPSPATPTAPPANVLMTPAQNNTIVTARVGDRIQIALGEQYRWELDPPDGVVLVHPVQNYMLVRGTQAIWIANAVGHSSIHATGAVACPSGSPCPLLLVVFNATVEVVP